MESYSESYKKAGVDVTAGYKAVELMKSHIARTMTANVLTDIGGFGGLYALVLSRLRISPYSCRLWAAPWRCSRPP